MTQRADNNGVPAEAFQHRVGYVLRRFNQALHGQVDDGLAALGLTISQYAVLSVLERFPGRTNAQLARTLSVTPQTMTRIVGGLLDRDLVERDPSADHARVLLTRLTTAGEHTVQQAHPVVDDAEDRLFAPLSGAQRADVLSAMLACAAASPADVTLGEP